MRFLWKGEWRVGSAGVPARNDVSCKKLPRVVLENQTAHLNRTWPFTMRAGTPALPTVLRTRHALDSHTPVTNRLHTTN